MKSGSNHESRFTIHAALLAALAAGCATQGAGTMPAVPAALSPSAGEKLSHETFARGVQIYECAASKAEPAKLEWVFKAPEAGLFERDGGKRVGRHYAGPSWESDDGSRIVGSLKARADAPQANAIPWLLLSAKSTGGAGVFSRTTSIQRVSTVGGVAPAATCAKAGDVARVPYTAVYYFYTSRQ